MSLKAKLRGPATSIDDQVESFATDRVPTNQRWPIPAISVVLLGGATAMFWFTYGAQHLFLVGFPLILIPIGYFVIGAVLTGMLTMRVASREGLSPNLLSRGLGFGSRGAAVTSFIYGINYVYYFLFEGTIVSHAIAIYFEIPIDSFNGTLIYAAFGLVTIAFAWRGMHAMSFLQKWGFPFFVITVGWAVYIFSRDRDLVGIGDWTATQPLTFAAMMSALSLANGQVIFQGLMATDYGRFASQRIRYRGTASIMIFELIPMLIVIGLGCFFGINLYSELSGPDAQSYAQDPGYLFVNVIGLLGVILVVVTQIRVNVMNLYSGSIALASGFEVAAKIKPGRPWWMFLIWGVGVLFYVTNVLNHLGTFLAIAGVLTNTWVLIILADYFVCRRWMKLGKPENVEFHEKEVPKWNPCGLTSLGVAVTIGAMGIIGIYPIYFASFVAMIVGPLIHIALTRATGGRYYTPKRTATQTDLNALDEADDDHDPLSV